MSGLERRAEHELGVPMPTADRRAGPHVDLAGSGLLVTDVEWSGTSIELTDLDITFPPTDWELANAVVDDGVVRRRGAGYLRRRVAWSARRADVVVATFEQIVVPQPDGRFRAVGTYRSASLDVHQTITPCVARRGDVPVDGASTTGAGDPGTGEDPNTDDRAREGKQFRRSHDAVAMLPAPVRRSIFARATPPTVFAARAVRREPSGTVTVTALRMRDDEAIAVIGSLQAGATTWQVEQRTYAFSGARRLTSGTRGVS